MIDRGFCWLFLPNLEFTLNEMLMHEKFTYIYRGRWTDWRRCWWSSLMATAATWLKSRTSAIRSWSCVWWASASALTSCAWCSGASSSTSTPSGAPSPTWSGRPRTWGEWSTCADIDYLTCFFKEGYFLREKGEIRSAEIINCGEGKNGLFWHDLIVIFCDIN